MIYEKAMELVAALRSGKYQQNRGRLRDEQKFCCLGVMCDISGLGTWDTSPYMYIRYRYFGATDYLPKEVAIHFGCASNYNDPSFRVESSGIGSLSTLNDGPMGGALIPTKNGVVVLEHKQPATFEQIADIIETYWEQL